MTIDFYRERGKERNKIKLECLSKFCGTVSKKDVLFKESQSQFDFQSFKFFCFYITFSNINPLCLQTSKKSKTVITDCIYSDFQVQLTNQPIWTYNHSARHTMKEET